MGDQLKLNQKEKIDGALNFFSKDCSEFECASGHLLNEFSVVLDGLLTSLSQIISSMSSHFFQSFDK